MVDLAQKQVGDYQQRWLPLQRNLAQSITAAGAPDSRERRQALGMTAAENTAQFSQAQTKLQAGLGQTGALGSSKGKLAIAGLGEDQATAQGLGQTRADQQINNAYIQGLGSIMSMGLGQKGAAIGGMTNLAAMSGRQAQADAQASLDNRMGDAQLGGQIAGMGLSYIGHPASSAVTPQNLAMANASSDPIGSLNTQLGWTH